MKSEPTPEEVMARREVLTAHRQHIAFQDALIAYTNMVYQRGVRDAMAVVEGMPRHDPYDDAGTASMEKSTYGDWIDHFDLVAALIALREHA